MELLYEAIEREIQERIQKGVFKVGDRVPSVRSMSVSHRVSPSTVTLAYQNLEARGVLEARPKSGFFVAPRLLDRVPQTAPIQSYKSGPSEVKTADLIFKIHDSFTSRDQIVPFGTATPGADLFPNTRLNRIIQNILREDPNHSSNYQFPPGFFPLRREIAKRMSGLGISASMDEIMITDGCSEALSLALQAVTKPGDSVMIESPTYFGILQAVVNAGLKVIEIPSDTCNSIDLDCVEDVFKRQSVAAGIFLPNFNNPTGGLLSDERKEKLVRIFEKYNTPLIEDDIYGELSFQGDRPPPLRVFSRKNQIMTCSSFSKTLQPGFRVGYILGGKYAETLRLAKVNSTLASSTLPQMVVAAYLGCGGYDRHLRKMRSAFAQQMNQLSTAVLTHFPEGTCFSRPKGGFVLWVQLPKGVDSVDLQLQALNEKISITPGSIFSASGKYKNFIRLNGGHPWSDRFEKAIKRLGQLVARNA